MVRAMAFNRQALTAMVIAGAVALLASTPAVAQVIVLKSTVRGLVAGQVVQDSTRIAIPAGGTVTVVLPSGATRTVDGPFAGRAAELTRGVRRDPGLFDAIASYVRSGGSTSSTVGALRSFVPRRTFSWREVAIEKEGDVCVEQGAPLTLTRRTIRQPLDVTVVDLNSTQRGRVSFAAGENSAPWPAEPGPRTGSFAILAPGRAMKQIRLRLIASLPAPEDTLQVLHRRKCVGQFNAYIEALKTGG